MTLENSKHETLNPKQIQNSNAVNPKRYDLEERSLILAQRVRKFVKMFPKTLSNLDDLKQLIRSSGSVGANYIEANESLSKKDFIYRIKICRKEAKETKYWLTLIDTDKSDSFEHERIDLVREVTELMKIFGAIITNFQK